VIGPRRLVLYLDRDGVGKTTQATIPGANVEAGADMGKDVLEGISNSLKVALLETNFGSILVSQIVDLFFQHKWFLQKVNEDVEALCDPDDVGAEFRTVLALDVHPLPGLHTRLPDPQHLHHPGPEAAAH